MKKHKWKILTVFFLTVFAAGVASMLSTPIYRASSQLLIKPGREDVYMAPTGSSPTIITRLNRKINAETSILNSHTLMIQLIEQIGIDRLYNFPDRTLKGFLLEKGILKGKKERKIPPVGAVYTSVKKSLGISSSSDSNVISVSFYWPDPVIASNVVNTLVDLYFVQRVKIHTDPQTYNFLKDQTEQWKRRLEESENDLEAFKRRYSIISLPEQKTMILSKLSEFESQQNKIDSEIQETSEMITSLKGQLSNLDQDIQLQEMVNRQSPTLTALKAKLVDLELQGLKEEINRVKQMIAEEEKKGQVVVLSGNSPIRQTLEGELLKAKAHLKALKTMEINQKTQVAAYQQQLKTLDGLENQMKELNRRLAINEANYSLYLTKFEEAKISDTMDKQKIASVSVIEPAIPPLRPIKSKKKRIVIIGSFLGLITGVGMVFLIEFTSPVFRTREDVDQFLSLPVLATLPKEK